MATPKKATPPPKKNTKQTAPKITKPKTKPTTANGTAAAKSSNSKSQKNKSTISNGTKTTKPPNPKQRQNGKRVKEEEEDVNSYTFPMERVKSIIKEDDSDLRISSDAVFLINKATEKFLDQFSRDAHKCCVRDRKKALAYKHLSSVGKMKRYEFLSDFVPEKIKAGDALERRKQVQEGTRLKLET